MIKNKKKMRKRRKKRTTTTKKEWSRLFEARDSRIFILWRKKNLSQAEKTSKHVFYNLQEKVKEHHNSRHGKKVFGKTSTQEFRIKYLVWFRRVDVPGLPPTAHKRMLGIVKILSFDCKMKPKPWLKLSYVTDPLKCWAIKRLNEWNGIKSVRIYEIIKGITQLRVNMKWNKRSKNMFP